MKTNKAKSLIVIGLLLIIAVLSTRVMAKDVPTIAGCTVVPGADYGDDNTIYLYQSRWVETQIVYYQRYGECWQVASPRLCPFIAGLDKTAACAVVIPTPVPPDKPTPTPVYPLPIATPPVFHSPVSPIFLPVIYLGK